MWQTYNNASFLEFWHVSKKSPRLGNVLDTFWLDSDKSAGLVEVDLYESKHRWPLKESAINHGAGPLLEDRMVSTAEEKCAEPGQMTMQPKTDDEL